MPIFRVGTETSPLHSELFQQPRKRESILFFNKTIVQFFPFLVKAFNQLNIPRIAPYLHQKKNWIPAFAGMMCYRDTFYKCKKSNSIMKKVKNVIPFAKAGINNCFSIITLFLAFIIMFITGNIPIIAYFISFFLIA